MTRIFVLCLAFAWMCGGLCSTALAQPKATTVPDTGVINDVDVLKKKKTDDQPAKARSKLSLVLDAEVPEVELRKDIVYGTGGGEELKLDLARPQGATGKLPCILWIHGGAWRAGSKVEFENPLRRSAQLGYVAASINYRLVPKHIFPAQVEDAKCAV